MGPRGQLAGRRRDRGGGGKEGSVGFPAEDERGEVGREASTEVESQQQRDQEEMGISKVERRSNHRRRVTLRRGDALRLHCTSSCG